MLGWVTRCLPGFNIIGLPVLLLCAFSEVLKSPLWKGLLPSKRHPGHSRNPAQDGQWGGLNRAQKILVAYALIIHLHMFGYTLCLAWWIYRATGKARRAFERRIWHASSPSPSLGSEGEKLNEQPSSPASLPSPVSTNAKIHDVTIDEGPVGDELVYAVILPNYGEDIHTLETTLKVLACHPRANNKTNKNKTTGNRQHHEEYIGKDLNRRIYAPCYVYWKAPLITLGFLKGM
ncbi:hypothetical protein N7486_006106 [Penicillium sp. IBT 16267x]|nr:hypothetical protein N7486_006106 [Penicillium sp. IBT 16267x]